MVDKLVALPRGKCGEVKALDRAALVALNRMLSAVVLGLADKTGEDAAPGSHARSPVRQASCQTLMDNRGLSQSGLADLLSVGVGLGGGLKLSCS